MNSKKRRLLWIITTLLLLALIGGLTAYWLRASIKEWRTGTRVLPGDPYGNCGKTTPLTLPLTTRIGLYEEFPVPWRLDKLAAVDFPVTLAVPAATRADFLKLKTEIQQTYPQVQSVYYWPLLTQEEGYYPGPWSDPAGIKRIAAEAEGLPVVWDIEMPLNQAELTWKDVEEWQENRGYLDQWFRQRQEPVQIWRSHRNMGLDPLFLRLIAMHYDPRDYPAVTLQLDLYMTGAGLPADETARILRCGVERYGERFVPAFGVLNDGEGPAEIFITPELFRRNLELARQAGVSEIWLFGVNGLNEEYLKALRETLPLDLIFYR